jgi:c-di-GMP-binding flagellar brake protein YcgR
MQDQWNRRKYQRVPVFFLVSCQQADLTRVGGKAYNLSAGGIAIKTNCPVGPGEQLTVEFMEPKTLNVHKVQGEVVWRQFHGDTSEQVEALFTAGIKFLNLEEASRIFIRESTESLGAR